MANCVFIGGQGVGDGYPVYIIAEIGINHNGDVETAKRLIDVAADAGCSAVKFQKRTPEVCVPPEQRDLLRETPWGIISYMEYRLRVEFDQAAYVEIDRHCREKGIAWFASCWDEPSVDFIARFDPPCYKIPSALLTDQALLNYHRQQGKPILLSTGMSTLEEIDRAVDTLGRENLILLHCNSTYPAQPCELNLRVMGVLRQRYGVPVGYSGHETGISPTVAAVAMGASVIERHITLDRAMWGSDQAASVEPQGLIRLVRDVRVVECAMGDGVKTIYPGELSAMKRLRRVR